MPSRSVMAVAHRGASACAPENTLAAFAEALRLGCRAVEFDLRLSRDGVPVVLHDPTVQRTTNGRGAVDQLTLHELQALDAGSWFEARFPGQRIPTLQETLAVLTPHAQAVIELKVPVAPDLLGGWLDEQGVLGSTLVISFQAAWLSGLRRRWRDLQIGLLTDVWSEQVVRQAQSIGAEVLVMSVDILGWPRILTAEEAGLEVWSYTANDVGLVAACAAMGVRGIITDHPDLIRGKNRQEHRE